MNILFYKNNLDGSEVAVTLENGTIWLTQKQIAAVFGTAIPAINKHIKNIIREGELPSSATISKMEIVAEEGIRQVRRTVDVYNLDMVISVGYRVNSAKATQFRIWATQRLKEFLVDGYTLNPKRLEQLDRIVNIIHHTGAVDNLQLAEARGLLDILGSYTRSFVLLNQFDGNTLKTDSLNRTITYEIKYAEAKHAIAALKRELMAKMEATELFGNEKDLSFEGTLKSIVQTFEDIYVYPTI